MRCDDGWWLMINSGFGDGEIMVGER